MRKKDEGEKSFGRSNGPSLEKNRSWGICGAPDTWGLHTRDPRRCCTADWPGFGPRSHQFKHHCKASRASLFQQPLQFPNFSANTPRMRPWSCFCRKSMSPRYKSGLLSHLKRQANAVMPSGPSVLYSYLRAKPSPSLARAFHVLKARCVEIDVTAFGCQPPPQSQQQRVHYGVLLNGVMLLVLKHIITGD